RRLPGRWRDGACRRCQSANALANVPTNHTLRGTTMSFSAWSIRNPVPTILLFVMLTIAGLFSFHAAKVQNFPDVDLPMITVVASLPGTAPAQMETEVARKLENAMATMKGLRHLHTTVQDGVATVSAE